MVLGRGVCLGLGLGNEFWGRENGRRGSCALNGVVGWGVLIVESLVKFWCIECDSWYVSIIRINQPAKMLVDGPSAGCLDPLNAL